MHINGPEPFYILPVTLLGSTCIHQIGRVLTNYQLHFRKYFSVFAERARATVCLCVCVIHVIWAALHWLHTRNTHPQQRRAGNILLIY